VLARLSPIARICWGSLIGVLLGAGLAGLVPGTGPAAAAAPRARTAPGSGQGAAPAAAAAGTLQACTAYARSAIERREVITVTPAACRGLSRTQVNTAASTAIRMTLTGGSKPDRRGQAAAASTWIGKLITNPAPAVTRPPPAASAGQPAGSVAASVSRSLGIGGLGEPGARIGALLAWLLTAASGAWVLVRWLLAGGSPLRGTATAAPPAVILGHVGAGLLGLVLWAAFMLSGWAALAWISLVLLAPVVGAGMVVLALGLPGPVRADRRLPSVGRAGAGRRGRTPVLVIAAHGLFAVVALLLVLLAAIGA
jgi:hypothetical protein